MRITPCFADRRAAPHSSSYTEIRITQALFPELAATSFPRHPNVDAQQRKSSATSLSSLRLLRPLYSIAFSGGEDGGPEKPRPRP